MAYYAKKNNAFLNKDTRILQKKTSKMRFELIPIIDKMVELYEQPRTFERFEEYLNTLQGGIKGHLALPISGFNPMAKAHLLDKLAELKKLEAELVIERALKDLNNSHLQTHSDKNFKVLINLSDDLQGGWTNRFASDYDSRFRINGLFSRHFCTPIFWSSESYTQQLIVERTLEYVFRTIYWLTKPRPMTLKEHLAQEVFVASHLKSKNNYKQGEFGDLEAFYESHQDTENYHVIFNFFYGDSASESLAFPTYGVVEKITGYDYSKQLAASK